MRSKTDVAAFNVDRVLSFRGHVADENMPLLLIDNGQAEL